MDNVRLLVGFCSAVGFAIAGSVMLNASDAMDISSVGGQTIDEAFFQAFGLFTRGVAYFLFSLAALAVAMTLPRSVAVAVARPDVPVPPPPPASPTG
jgi:hypothetical protein